MWNRMESTFTQALRLNVILAAGVTDKSFLKNNTCRKVQNESVSFPKIHYYDSESITLNV